MTTYAAFAAAISGLTITSVVKAYTFRPESLDLSSGPASYVELPSGDMGDMETTCRDLGKTRAIQLVVAVKSANEDNPEPNYDATVAMMDNVEAALDAYAATNKSVVLDYSITTSGQESVFAGGISFWAVIATVTITDY